MIKFILLFTFSNNWKISGDNISQEYDLIAPKRRKTKRSKSSTKDSSKPKNKFMLDDASSNKYSVSSKSTDKDSISYKSTNLSMVDDASSNKYSVSSKSTDKDSISYKSTNLSENNHLESNVVSPQVILDLEKTANKNSTLKGTNDQQDESPESMKIVLEDNPKVQVQLSPFINNRTSYMINVITSVTLYWLSHVTDTPWIRIFIVTMVLITIPLVNRYLLKINNIKHESILFLINGLVMGSLWVIMGYIKNQANNGQGGGGQLQNVGDGKGGGVPGSNGAPAVVGDGKGDPAADGSNKKEEGQPQIVSDDNKETGNSSDKGDGVAGDNKKESQDQPLGGSGQHLPEDNDGQPKAINDGGQPQPEGNNGSNQDSIIKDADPKSDDQIDSSEKKLKQPEELAKPAEVEVVQPAEEKQPEVKVEEPIPLTVKQSEQPLEKEQDIRQQEPEKALVAVDKQELQPPQEQKVQEAKIKEQQQLVELNKKLVEEQQILPEQKEAIHQQEEVDPPEQQQDLGDHVSDQFSNQSSGFINHQVEPEIISSNQTIIIHKAAEIQALQPSLNDLENDLDSLPSDQHSKETAVAGQQQNFIQTQETPKAQQEEEEVDKKQGLKNRIKNWLKTKLF